MNDKMELRGLMLSPLVFWNSTIFPVPSQAKMAQEERFSAIRKATAEMDTIVP